MLLLGFFISCFKQLCFGLTPSQALSAGITAWCTGTVCSPRCLAAQEAGADQFGKAKAHLKASQPGGSTARARASIWKWSTAPLAGGRGVSWWLLVCHCFPGSGARGQRRLQLLGEGTGGAPPLQLDQQTHTGEGQLSCGNAACVRAGLCHHHQRAGWGAGRCWAVPGSPAVGKGCEVPTARLSTGATSSW